MANHEKIAPHEVTYTNIQPAIATAIVEEAKQRPEVTIVNRTFTPGNKAPEISGGIPFYLKRTKEFDETEFVTDMILADQVSVIEGK